jgi:hypothetical protein
MTQPPPPPPSYPPYGGDPSLYPVQKSSGAGVWIVVGVVAVVLLCGLGIFGLIATALVGAGTVQHDDASAPVTGTLARPGLHTPGLAGADVLGDNYLRELRARTDLADVAAPRCDGTRWDYGSIPAAQTFSSIEVRMSGPRSALASLQGRLAGTPATNLITFRYVAGSWCIAN